MDFLKLRFFEKEIMPCSEQILVSNVDGMIQSHKNVVLKPGEHTTFSFKHDLLGQLKHPQISIRSGLAQAFLNAELNESGLHVKNLHPTNDYLVPEGETAFARLYSLGDSSVSGWELNLILEKILKATNTFSKHQPRILQDEILIPFALDYAHEVASYSKNKPVNIREIPSGVKRWEVKSVLGTRGVTENLPNNLKKSLENKGARILATCYFETPGDIALVIQNPDSLESRVVDGGFKHMVVGEFHDDLLTNKQRRTSHNLSLKAYRLKYV